MNCTDFKNAAQQWESPDLSGEMLEHSKTCSTCTKVWAAEKRILSGFSGLKHAFRPKDLSKGIMSRVSMEKSRIDSPTLLEKVIKLLFPGTPIGSAIMYGLGGFILLVLFQRIFFRAHELPKTSVGGESAWELSLVKGSVTPPMMGVEANAGRVRLQDGQKIRLSPSSVAILVLGEVAQVRLQDGCFEAREGGLRLLEGQAHFKVAPRGNEPPFFVETPLGTVSVVGTEFLVELTEKSLKVSVREGSVKVAEGTKIHILGPSQEKIIKVFVDQPALKTVVGSEPEMVVPTEAPPANE